MGDGTRESPYTREDMLKLLEEHGGKAKGLNFSYKWFEKSAALRDFGEAYLAGADLKGVDLSGSHFEKSSLGGANLEEAHLEGIHLEEASLESTHFKGAYAQLAHFERAYLKRADLRNSELRAADFSGAILGSARLEGAYLEDTRFSSETQLEAVDWGNFVLGEENNGFFGKAADIYRRLKQWYTNAGMYDIAGKFFYREMKAKRKALSWKNEPLSKLWSWMLRLLCGYGEKYERVVVSAIVVIFGLAIAYRLWGSFNTTAVWDMLYYSAVSFTAVGYGNWAPQPAGWAKGAGVAEAFLGAFMMALFLVTFTRKMTR